MERTEEWERSGVERRRVDCRLENLRRRERTEEWKGEEKSGKGRRDEDERSREKKEKISQGKRGDQRSGGDTR